MVLFFDQGTHGIFIVPFALATSDIHSLVRYLKTKQISLTLHNEAISRHN